VLSKLGYSSHIESIMSNIEDGCIWLATSSNQINPINSISFYVWTAQVECFMLLEWVRLSVTSLLTLAWLV